MMYKLLLLALLSLGHSYYVYSCEHALTMQATSADGTTSYTIRKMVVDDSEALKKLYQRVASRVGGLARTYDEITDAYIMQLLVRSINNGFALVAEYDGTLIGSIIKYKLEPKVFSHVLTEGSILVDPDFQAKGIGSMLIKTLLHEIEEHHPEILRVEIIARESNPAIKLYERIGFKKEGRFEGRIKGVDGKLEADIPMAWINPKVEPSVYD